mgnify:CR=1 FL=1
MKIFENIMISVFFILTIIMLVFGFIYFESIILKGITSIIFIFVYIISCYFFKDFFESKFVLKKDYDFLQEKFNELLEKEE